MKNLKSSTTKIFLGANLKIKESTNFPFDRTAIYKVINMTHSTVTLSNIDPYKGEKKLKVPLSCIKRYEFFFPTQKFEDFYDNLFFL